MIITKVEIQKKDKNRVNLYVDDEFFCGLSLETILKNHIKEKQEISNEFLSFLKNESEFSVAMSKAGNYLSKVQKTEKEVRDYLFKKGFEQQMIFEVVKKLKDFGYIDDSLYAKSFVKFKSKSSGSKKIAFELVKKGIDQNLIEENISCIKSEVDTANNLLSKYLKNKNLDLKTKQKAYRFLLSKGFKNDDILICLKKVFMED